MSHRRGSSTGYSSSRRKPTESPMSQSSVTGRSPVYSPSYTKTRKGMTPTKLEYTPSMEYTPSRGTPYTPSKTEAESPVYTPTQNASPSPFVTMTNASTRNTHVMGSTNNNSTRYRSRHARSTNQDYSPLSKDELQDYSPSTNPNYSPSTKSHGGGGMKDYSPSNGYTPSYQDYSPSNNQDYSPSYRGARTQSRTNTIEYGNTNAYPSTNASKARTYTNPSTHKPTSGRSTNTGTRGVIKRERGGGGGGGGDKDSRHMYRQRLTSPSYTQTVSRSITNTQAKTRGPRGRSETMTTSPHAPGASVKAFPRDRTSMFEQITSPTEDGGSPYMMQDGQQPAYSPSAYSPITAYSPVPQFTHNARGIFTPQTVGYSPNTGSPTPYSPYSTDLTGVSPDAMRIAKKKRLAERTAKREKQEQARAKKREGGKDKSKDKMSGLFTDVDDTITDFMWDQKFKSHSFTYACRPKFVLQNVETTQMIDPAMITSFQNTTEMISYDWWASSSILHPLNDKVCGNISIDENDPILDASTIQADKDPKQIERETTIKMTEKEALYLRRGMLISNDLDTDGLHFRHGVEGAEKKLIREPPEDLDSMKLVDRIEKTFKHAAATPVHPRNPNIKVKRVMPFIPNRDLWAHPYTQVKYDEAPALPTLQKVPPVLYKAAPTPALTAFAIFQYNDDVQAHVLDRSYAWDNQGECSMAAEEESEFALIEWPVSRPDEDSSKKTVMFSSITNEVRLRKLTAILPYQRKTFESQCFGAKSLGIAWRHPTEDELDAEKKLVDEMFE